MINRQKPPAWSVIKAKLKPWGRDELLGLIQETQIIGWGFGDRVGDLVKGLDQLLGGGAETRANPGETVSRTSGAATKDASSAP